MKLFRNLQTKSYTTPIGNINISNFYNFYRKDFVNKRMSSIEIDNKTTLVEASIKVYSNPDMMWALLFTNNKINPFKLTKQNATNYLNNTSGLVSFNPVTTNSGFYGAGITFTVPSGSVLTTYSENTGASWSYSSIGNFDLNGPFSVVEKPSSYSLSVTIKESKNNTSGNIVTPGTDNGGTFSFIYNGATYYRLNNKATNKNTLQYSKTIEKEVAKNKSKEVVTDSGLKNTDTKEFNFLQESETDYLTVEQNIKAKTKMINFIVLSDLSSSLSKLIVPKYSIS
jgi:hypothetical protein